VKKHRITVDSGTSADSPFSSGKCLGFSDNAGPATLTGAATSVFAVDIRSEFVRLNGYAWRHRIGKLFEVGVASEQRLRQPATCSRSQAALPLIATLARSPCDTVPRIRSVIARRSTLSLDVQCTPRGCSSMCCLSYSICAGESPIWCNSCSVVKRIASCFRRAKE